ncbi:MAG: PaaI family thioesterase [Gammaproteobacteria bacterium]|nr:PaaI family thioesterase [Gammaproteobacteria bacterium]
MNPTKEYGTGVLDGYETWPGWDPHEDNAGPMYFRTTAQGTRCAMLLEDKHCNTSKIAHGGLLVTFADFSTFAISRPQIGGGGATVTMNADFCAAARSGELLESEGEVMRETRSLLFFRGRLFVGETTVLNFSTVVKKPRKTD